MIQIQHLRQNGRKCSLQMQDRCKCKKAGRIYIGRRSKI